MGKRLGSFVFQGLVFVTCTVLAFAILVHTDVVRRLAYLVEKGRIQALRESLPSDDEVARINADTRAVAAIVTPAVVQVITEKRFDVNDLLTMHDRAAVSSNGTAPSIGTNGMTRSERLERLLRSHEGIRARDGYGSGFVVDAEHGYVVTNDHVINGADAIHVRLADGRLLDARLLGADPRGNLAVIQIDADGLHELTLADSDAVEVGDAVMSVGNPFGLAGSVSQGIVSAKARTNIDINGTEYRGFIQTDAVINPGNSGGPLVNLRGEVVAINTAIATNTGHFDGVGFAIPARRIRQALPALIRGEQVPRGYLGVSIVNAFADQDEAQRVIGIMGEVRGVLVRDVVPDSPAARFGLQTGDVITAIDGQPLRDTADLIDIVGDTTPGTDLTLAVERGGKLDTYHVTVGRQPAGFSTRRPIDD